MAKSFNISYKFQAIDQFSAVGEKISQSVQDVQSSIAGVNKTTAETGTSFAQLAERAGEFGEKLKSVGKRISTHISAPLAVLGGNMMRLANTQAQAEAKLILGLKNYQGQAKFTFEELSTMASELQRKSLFGDEEIIGEVQVPLLRFKNFEREEFVKTQQVILDIAASTGRGLRRIAIQVARALNEPARALVSLEMAGIDLKMDNLQETLAELEKRGEHSTAQMIILDLIMKQVGGSAEALARIGTGPLKQFWMSLGDINEKIGDEILVILTPIIDKMREIAFAFDAASPPIRKFIAWAILIGAVLGPTLIGLGFLLIGIKAIGVAGLAFSVTILAVGAALAIGIYAGIKFRQLLNEKLTPALEKISTWGEWVAKNFLALGDGMKNIIDVLGIVTAGIFAVSVAMIALTGVSLPIIITVLAIAAAFYVGYRASKMVANFFDGALSGALERLSGWAASLKDKILELKDALVGFLDLSARWDAVKSFFGFGDTTPPADIGIGTPSALGVGAGVPSRDSADITITLKSPQDVVDEFYTKSTGNLQPKLGWQMSGG